MKKVFLKVFSIFTVILLGLGTIALPISYGLAASNNTIYQGIDVSSWQKTIDYAKVKADGISIVYMKASEGSTYRDPYFQENYQNAKANGLKVGFYHFVRARNTTQAVQEAEFFASVIRGLQPDCRLAMDFETFGNLSVNEINQIGLTFLRKVEELTGKNMVVYSNTYTARTVWNQTIANQYPLWVAQYGPANPSDNGKWNNWVGFQYTDKGRVKGVNGYVDKDYFTKDILLDNTTQIPGGDTQKPSDKIYYTVQRGDNLTKIARRYGVTVNAIVAENKIANPNLIYPGQKLVIPIATEEINNRIYVVRRGDNLTKIARRYGVTVNAIVAENSIANPNLIYPGQKLIIPKQENQVKQIEEVVEKSCQCDLGHMIYKVQKGDTLNSIADKFNETNEEILLLNNITEQEIKEGLELRICRFD